MDDQITIEDGTAATEIKNVEPTTGEKDRGNDGVDGNGPSGSDADAIGSDPAQSEGAESQSAKIERNEQQGNQATRKRTGHDTANME